MRKNRKLVAILTLLMFAVVMVAPVAGNADVTGTEAATDVTIAHNAGTATVNLSGLHTDGTETYTVVDKDNSGATIETTPNPITTEATATVTLTDIPDNNTATDEVYNFGVNSTTGGTDVVTFTVTVEADPVAVATAGLSATASVIDVKDNDVRVNKDAKIDLVLRNSSNENTTPSVAVPVYVWAEAFNTPGQATDALKSIDGTTANNNGVFTVTTAQAVTEIEAQFARSGDYKVYASLDTVDPKKTNESRTFLINGDNNIKVRPESTTVEAVQVDANNPTNYSEVKVGTNDYTGKDKFINVDANGIGETEVKVTVYQDAAMTKVADAGTPVTFTASNGFKVNKESLTTDYRGQVEVKLTGSLEGEYKLYVDADGYKVTVPVKVAPQVANTIELVKQPNDALAENESIDEGTFKFKILDINGNLMYDLLAGQGGDKLLAKDSAYFKLSTPNGSNLEKGDISFAPIQKNGVNTGEFSLNFAKRPDVVGDYSLKMALDNGSNITFKWTVAKFGTAKELVIDYGVTTVELGRSLEAPEIYFLDENGVRKDAAAYTSLGANGYALKSFETEGQNKGALTVQRDEKYLGSLVNVYGVAEAEGLTATVQISVSSGDAVLSFKDQVGPVDTNNRVAFEVVDSKGNKMVPGANKKVTSATAVIVSKSNPDARVSANVATSSFVDIVEKGEGILSLTSNAVTDAEVLVTIMVEDVVTGTTTATDVHLKGTNVYSGTLNYSFGKEADMVDRVVVMTIGSNDVIVNNETTTIDVAPFVNDDWRTMVPYRALVEAFGAQVDWDEDARTVTATLDGVEVVMTIGEMTYTVNGVEKNADTAPVIVDGRTLVPVRFPAEAFGFDVLALYDDVDGTTASVLFTK